MNQKQKKRIKNILWNLFAAAMIAIIGYILVSSAAKHTALDNELLYQWRLNWADRK